MVEKNTKCRFCLVQILIELMVVFLSWVKGVSSSSLLVKMDQLAAVGKRAECHQEFYSNLNLMISTDLSSEVETAGSSYLW